MRHLFFIIIFLSLVSCNQENTSPVGEDFFGGIDTRMYFIDTLTVNLSTFQFDSLQVSNPSRLLIGSYKDPVFGRTTSSTYAQLTNSIYTIDDDAKYDSIALILRYDDYFYNDTIPTQQFNVYKVTETIEPKDDDAYYNTTSFTYNTTPIAIKNFITKPIKNDSLNIEIDDSFGSTLFNKLQENEINNSDEFLQEYKGLLVAPSNSNTTILGFEPEGVLRIYYTIDNEDDDDNNETIDITFNTANTFSNTISNQTDTYFSSIINQETILPSTSTNNSSYIQSGVGIATRLDIPYLRSLNEISGKGTVLNAQLKISLKQDEASKNLITKDELQVVVLDKKGNVISSLALDDENYVTGVITNDNPEFESDVYTFNLIPFVDIKLGETYEEYFLGIYPQDFNNSVDRYVFNDSYTANDLRMKLEITYAVYDEN